MYAYIYIYIHTPYLHSDSGDAIFRSAPCAVREAPDAQWKGACADAHRAETPTTHRHVYIPGNARSPLVKAR